MSTFPQAVLALALVLGGIATPGYLLESTKQAAETRAANPPPPPVFSCHYGQILVPPSTCINLPPGNVDLNLDQGSRFSTPNSEYAQLTIRSGRIRINDIYSPSVMFYVAGQTIDVSANKIVTALEPNTRIEKRLR